MIRLPADVLFAFGSAELTPAAKQAIAPVDDEIGSGGTGTVTIEGHTDAIGGDADNQALSERRAGSVEGYLVARGIEAQRITARGYGEGEPVADNDTADGRARNRRVDLLLKGKAR